MFSSAVTCEMNDASNNHGELESTVSTYSVDIETLQQIALKGDAQALFQLAISYEQGRGVAENQQEAFYCYQQAAELGSPRGYWGMAFLYDLGKYGVKRDKKKADEMHRKAGAAGYAPSASKFGATWPDAARALGLSAAEAREQSRIRHRAAAEGYASEQYNLGVMYQTGFGLPKDMAKAREWFQKAADQDDVQAKSILKKLQ